MKKIPLFKDQMETESVGPENSPNSMDCNVAPAQTDDASVSGTNQNDNVGGIVSNDGQQSSLIDFGKLLFVLTFHTKNSCASNSVKLVTTLYVSNKTNDN